MTVYEVEAGDRIDRVIEKAIKLAKQKNTNVEFTFNDTTLTVYPESSTRDCYERYVLMRESNKVFTESQNRRQTLEEILKLLKAGQ